LRLEKILEVYGRMDASKLEEKTKKALSRLGLGHWRVSWLPDSSCSVRGRAIPERFLIEIYDPDEEDVWTTFIHEVLEIKLRSALRPYRVLVNKLIEGYQEIADGEKDRFIESLPEIFDTYDSVRGGE
jgi:hypothetical protein